MSRSNEPPYNLRLAQLLAIALAILVAGCASSPPANTAAGTTTTAATSTHAPAKPSSPGQHGMVEDFSDAESFAMHFDDPKRDHWQKPQEVIALLTVTHGMTVVDLGAGTGYFLPYLSKAAGPNGSVLALDTEPGMVEFMNARVDKERLQNVQPTLVPPDDPALDPGSVDRLLIVNTWHHISDRKQYAKKLFSAMRAGGQVLVVDFNDESPIGPPVHHRLTADSVADELRSAGFVASVAEESLPYQYVVVGEAR